MEEFNENEKVEEVNGEAEKTIGSDEIARNAQMYTENIQRDYVNQTYYQDGGSRKGSEALPVLALVFAIFGLLMLCCMVGWVFATASLVLAIVALVKYSPYKVMSLVSIVIDAVTLMITAVVVMFYLLGVVIFGDSWEDDPKDRNYTDRYESAIEDTEDEWGYDSWFSQPDTEDDSDDSTNNWNTNSTIYMYNDVVSTDYVGGEIQSRGDICAIIDDASLVVMSEGLILDDGREYQRCYYIDLGDELVNAEVGDLIAFNRAYVDDYINYDTDNMVLQEVPHLATDTMESLAIWHITDTDDKDFSEFVEGCVTGDYAVAMETDENSDSYLSQIYVKGLLTDDGGDGFTVQDDSGAEWDCKYSSQDMYNSIWNGNVFSHAGKDGATFEVYGYLKGVADIKGAPHALMHPKYVKIGDKVYTNLCETYEIRG